MRLKAKTDLDAPVDYVFRGLSDHALWEKEALSRGIDVEKSMDTPIAGASVSWVIQFLYHGRMVKVQFGLVEVLQNQQLAFVFESQQIQGNLIISVAPLSPRTTRLHMVIEARPRTIAARLLLNTMLLTKGRIEARLETRLRWIADQIRIRYQSGRG